MIDYKRAAVIGLKIPSAQGLLTIKQVKGLNSNSKKAILIRLAEELKVSDNSDLLGFLENDMPKVHPDTQLTFDIVKDLYTDQIGEEMNRNNARDLNEEEQELLAIKAEQDRDSLRNNPKEVEKRLADIAKRKQ